MRKLLAFMLLVATAQVGLAEEHVVEMKNVGSDGTMVFEPGFLQVAVGDTVRFVVADPAHNSQSLPELIPEGASGWRGAINEEVTVTLDTEGVYVYQCLPHAALAMVGVIVAGDAVNMEQINANVGGLKSKFLMSQDRLDGYLAKIK